MNPLLYVLGGLFNLSVNTLQKKLQFHNAKSYLSQRKYSASFVKFNKLNKLLFETRQ